MNAPQGTTTTAPVAGTVDTCGQFREQTSCPPADCHWESYAPAPVFTREFCHPVGDIKKTTPADWEKCFNQPSGTCAAPCVLSNGIEMIPKTEDFCVIQFETKNVTAIFECMNADQAKCSGQCKWQKAPVVGTNDKFIVGSAVFESNFCHPIVTGDWDKNAPACYVHADAQSCQKDSCVWSTGKEFAPVAQGYCLPATLTSTIPDFEGCTKFNTTTTCPTQCKWHPVFD
jgi:hypothetical protein